MDIYKYIEIVSVLLSLTYLFLMIRENIWCWSFGIVSSLLSIFLFMEAKLYSESILYFIYVLVGIYGWYVWGVKGKAQTFKIQLWNAPKHLILLISGFILSGMLGYFFATKTDANNPYLDAHTSVFGLIASYMEAHKVLTGWLFWIILNALSAWLYYMRGLEIYAGLMAVYFVLSFAGFYQWKRRFEAGG